MTVDEKALQAAIPVGSNMANADLVRAIIEAYESARSAEPVAWPDLEEGVVDILSDFRGFISARPMLVSLLYDIDMLPEQCVTRAGAIRLAGLCEVWRMGEAGQLPTPVASEIGEEEIARAIARCVDEEQFYNAPGFQNAARAVLALLQPALERARREGAQAAIAAIRKGSGE